MDYLSEEDVLCIRRRLAKTEMAGRDFGEIEPVKFGEFSSAVARQRAGYGRFLKYATPESVGATLFYGIAPNHAFENGNKRTALVTLLAFLHRNKIVVSEATEDDLYDLATQLAAHTLPLPRAVHRNPDSEVAAIAQWVTRHSRRLELGDRMMRYREFRRQLEELGCSFDKPKNNFIKIHRTVGGASISSTIGYEGPDFEIPVDQIKRVRKMLKLDEVNGFDSASFYDLETSVDVFVNKYRQLLDRLAET